MNEYHFPIACCRWDNGGLAFIYEFMHVCKNVGLCILQDELCRPICMLLRMQCMCVRLANDFINVKTEIK